MIAYDQRAIRLNADIRELPKRFQFDVNIVAVGDGAFVKKAHAINIGIQNTLVYRVNFLFRSAFQLIPLMATIYLRDDSEGLPTRRGALYRESILLLLDRWTQNKPDAPSLIEMLGEKSSEDLYARLAALAYEVHERYGEQPGTPEISY